MVKAYSLISTDPGATSEIYEKVKKIEGVKSVEAVAGPYDIVVRIEVDSLERLTGAVFGKIRGVDGVTSTTTLIVVGFE
ncbi:MAG: Lrp/AsnC family transcriptional regulator [Candidatus Hadarchaeia archaeon]